ncbi:MAG: hypothetical protein H7Z21_17515 [Hymenobacter sp.]|nr:hypothetical protein [Hymenobacter sp.]
MNDIISKAHVVLHLFYEAVCAGGRKPPFKPVIKVATTPGPIHYDHAQQAVILVPYELLSPAARAGMDRYGAIGTLGLSGREQYEEVFHNLLIPHELGHWLQMVAYRPLTRWQAEYGANRLMVAFWREQATEVTAPLVEARLANFVVQPATFPALLPEGLLISVETYFNEGIEEIEKNALWYAGFQKHMVRQAMAEEPRPRFRNLVESTWPLTT